MSRRAITRWMRVRHAIETGAVLAVEQIARIAPNAAVVPLGSTIGAITYVLDGRHRRVARGNVRRAYGDALPGDAQRRIVRRSFAHVGRVAIEVLRFGRLSAASIDRVATFEGVDHLREAHARGRGVVICGAHFGNWELHGLLQGWLGYPVAVVARPMDNPSLDRVITRLRARSGNTVIDKRLSLHVISDTLRRGNIVAVLVDQRPRRSGVFAPFFGRAALTSPGPALLALRTGAALVPAFSTPQPDGKYRCVYEPEIPVVRTGDIAADVTRLTIAYTEAVERWVRQCPDVWLWMHDRWRAPRPAARDNSTTSSR